MRRIVLVIAMSIAATLSAIWLWAAQTGIDRMPQLPDDLPSGALMTLESPDFARLLHDWDNSSEQTAWLNSASFSAFINSHLWDRLTGAKQEFAGAASADLGSKFLHSVAGTETIFAWYDIGKLEFLYITRLSPGQASGVQLLAEHGKFSERKAGDAVFYVRSGTKTDAANGPGQERTVAFAQRGDYLFLATREDLIANALLRTQGSKDVQGITDEGWYKATEKSASGPHGELHMLLDLQRISKTPQFETYWVQRNVTGTRRFRAAVGDLYRERGRFREERTLLPMDAGQLPPESGDAAALEQLVPERAGVYRILTTPSVSDALTELRDKILERAPASRISYDAAPDAYLSVPEPGDARDLETRIDSPQPPKEATDAWLTPLRDALGSARLTAMMTVSRSDLPTPPALFFPIHSAVVLRRNGDWDDARFSAAVLASLRRQMTVGTIGLDWKMEQAGGESYLITTGAQRMALSIQGNTAILSTDAALLREMLARNKQATNPLAPALVIAAFRHAQEQPAFSRLSNVLDGAAAQSQNSTTVSDDSSSRRQQGNNPGTQPTFFRDNLGSLSRTFSAFATEHFTERKDGANLRQTVLYTLVQPDSHR